MDRFAHRALSQNRTILLLLHAYPITRAADDPFQSQEINYHYILVEVRGRRLKATMNRLEMKDGIANWPQPDSVTISSARIKGTGRDGHKKAQKAQSIRTKPERRDIQQEHAL